MSEFLKKVEKRGIEKFGKDNFEDAVNEARINIEITNVIAIRRKELNITQKHYSELLNTTQAQISKYEKLMQSPTLKKFIKMIGFLNLDIILVDKNTNEEIYHS